MARERTRDDECRETGKLIEKLIHRDAGEGLKVKG
jgi:hypothetical protein